MFEIELIIYTKMDLVLNDLRRLICHKTQQTKPNRLAKVEQCIWQTVQTHVVQQTKKSATISVYRAVSLAILLCGSKLWVTYYHLRLLERFHKRCSGIILKIPWCNGYRRRKWTRRHEFKFWTRLIAFHIALIPLGKV